MVIDNHMGIFEKIFKSRNNKTVDSSIGTFKLVYSKKHKNLWSAEINSIYTTVRGTDNNPDEELIAFVSTIPKKIEDLSEKISIKFKREFKNAGLEINFNDWHDKFKIVATEVMMIIDNESFWSITFEDIESPFAEFTVYIEGESINSDFSIDK